MTLFLFELTLIGLKVFSIEYNLIFLGYQRITLQNQL